LKFLNYVIYDVYVYIYLKLMLIDLFLLCWFVWYVWYDLINDTLNDILIYMLHFFDDDIHYILKIDVI